MKRLALSLLALCAAASLRAEEPASFTVGAFTFQRPADWAWVQVNSPMRKAQLRVTGATAETSADVTFFHFGPGGGGGVKANIDRWVGQFRTADGATKIEPQEIAGAKVTLVSTEGTFSSGMPGGPTTPMDGYALLGAIVENADGDVFVKLTGPAALVKESRKKFLDFIGGALAAAKK